MFAGTPQPSANSAPLPENAWNGGGGASGDPGKQALQPREMKFSTAAPLSEGRFSESGGGRRGFKAPTKLHALTARSAKRNCSFDPEGGGEDGGAQKGAGKADSLGIALSTAGISTERSPRGAWPAGAVASSPPAVIAGKPLTAGGFTVQSTSDNVTSHAIDGQRKPRRRRANVDGSLAETQRNTAVVYVPGQARWGRGTAKGSIARALAPLPATASTSGQSHHRLLIEGNSLHALEAPSQAAMGALAQLQECVADERRLRERLDAAREAKLAAFRAVIKVYTESCGGAAFSQTTPATTGLEKAASVHTGCPDTLALAKCSVVTNTLVTTIQSYVRAKQARQLTCAVDHLKRALGASSQACVDYNATLSLRPGLEIRSLSGLVLREHGGSLPSAFDGTGTTSVEDVLDLDEVNRLRQLYFDYFDCEAVPLTSLGESNAIENGFAPPHGCPPIKDLLNTTNPSSALSSATSPVQDEERGPDAASTFSLTL